MATLVLSTVGTALGGPVGGAIGSLIGQSIDQQIFSSPTKGPRLGDLAVQTSSYGTRIPRIYGTMRVAGSIVWATDLVESSATPGAKGQPDVTYSYSVSFAVALSSRPLREIRRIWADGNLLRGAAGDFKVSTEFRFHDGSVVQTVDPLIGSIEGVLAEDDGKARHLPPPRRSARRAPRVRRTGAKDQRGASPLFRRSGFGGGHLACLRTGGARGTGGATGG